jgi:hypothetical protein
MSEITAETDSSANSPEGSLEKSDSGLYVFGGIALGIIVVLTVTLFVFSIL